MTHGLQAPRQASREGVGGAAFSFIVPTLLRGNEGNATCVSVNW